MQFIFEIEAFIQNDIVRLPIIFRNILYKFEKEAEEHFLLILGCIKFVKYYNF